MLVFAFSTAVFSSVIWLIYAVMYIRNILSEAALMQQDAATMLTLVAIIILPILVIWLVFGYLNQFLSNRSINRKQTELLTQLQKNQDYTDLVVRVMLDAEHEIKDGFVLNKFDVFISDMNETLSEIIQRCNIASSAQLDQLWQRVRRGEKWSLGKAILDASKNQNTFDAWVREKANRDKVFRGSLLEFCSRYQGLLFMLEKHDRDKVFLKIIESGVFGKVYSIIAPLTDGIADLHIAATAQKQPEQHSGDYASVLKLANMEEPKAQESIMNVDKNDEETTIGETLDNDTSADSRTSFFSKLNPFRKTEPQSSFMADNEPDPFFQALHNSFQGTPSIEDNLPSFDAIKLENGTAEPSFDGNIATSDVPSFGHSQNILNNLRATNENNIKEPTISTANEIKQESNTIKAPSVKPIMEEKEEDLAYPFGGWTNENNYRG